MIPLVFALLLTQDKPIVEGIVVNALTNEPLRKADVTLAGKKTYTVVSSSDGKFRFEAIEPGEYQPRLQRQGFLYSDDEPSIEVSSGQQVKDVVIKLTPQGIIAGHVVDEDGDPVPYAVVNVDRFIPASGHNSFLDSNQDRTNSEGYFFIEGLKAGRYRISASAPDNRRHFNPGPHEDFIRTEDPLPFQLAPGAAARNVEIRLRKSTVFRVSGKVSNAPKGYRALTLANESETYTAPILDGAFSFESVAPGSYTLTVSSLFFIQSDGSATAATLFCHLPVTVSDHDVEGVVAELAPGSSIEGTIRIDGEGHFNTPPTAALFGPVGINWVTAKADGKFGWTNLFPGVHPLHVPEPDGFYIKSIHFNHQPVKDSKIDLSSGAGGTLEIVVAPNPATISATVPEGKNAMVGLWSGATFSTHYMDATGVVNFTGLAPGEYFIAAWQKAEFEYIQIPEFRARFNAQKITLAEGSHESIEVKLIPKSASDAEVTRLQ
jgi:hypothetical protein